MLKNERTGKSGKFLCALLAAAIALTMLITPQAGAMESDAESTASGNVDYKTILGDAVNFGVTTEDFQLRGGDAQTNVAAIKGICTSQTGNEITNKEEQTFILANIDTVFKIKGQGAGAYVRTTKESRGKLEGSGEKVIIDTTSTEKQLTDEVNAMLDHAWDQSAILASHEDTAVLEPDKNDHAKYMVDLTGKHAGTYYVTITDEDLKDKFNGGDRLRIYKSIDQNIIFNVTAKGNNRSIDIWKAPINGKNPEDFYNTKDKSAEDQATAQTIVWNIVNATDVHLHPVAGIILAPKGTASTEETGSGWIVAKSVNIKGGEWHNTYQNVKKTRNDNDKAELAAKKQVNGADSQVSGFKFRLEEKTNQEWEAVGSEIENEGAAISFPTIEYDADDAGGHIYRITETKGNVDSNGNSYDADKSVYYAKVTVSKYDIIEGTEVKGAAVSASKPEYFSDEKCTKPVDLPVFNNTSKSDETSVSVTKVWDDNDNNDGFRPADIEVQLQADGKDVDGKIIKLASVKNCSQKVSIESPIKIRRPVVQGFL